MTIAVACRQLVNTRKVRAMVRIIINLALIAAGGAVVAATNIVWPLTMDNMDLHGNVMAAGFLLAGVGIGRMVR